MSNMIRSTGFQFILLFALVLSAASCGDESEVIIQDLNCDLDGFTGGNFIFTVDGVSTTCPISTELLDQFVSPGDQFPVVLPAVEDLPPTIDIDFGPPIGAVTFAVEVQEDRLIVTSTQPITIPDFGFGNITGTVLGSVCPIEGGEILAAFTISLTSPFSCSLQISATGR